MSYQYLKSATTRICDRSYLKNINYNSIQADLDNGSKTSARAVHWTRAKARGLPTNCTNLEWCSLPNKNQQVFHCEAYADGGYESALLDKYRQAQHRRKASASNPLQRDPDRKITQQTTKHMKHSPTKAELIYVLILVCLMLWIVPIYEYLMGL